MLNARGLCKSFGKLPAVHDVSVSVSAGEIVGLLGPNGAGKSTTAAMLCGITSADAGVITVDTVPLGERTHDAKRLIGLVPQDLALIEDLSALDNIMLFGSLYGIKGALLRSRAREALDLVGLGDRARSRPATFSGGMKRRLNIACALVHDPKVLVLDEPTVGIDPQSRNHIFENLETLRSRGKALLYTTHYMEEVERLCDRIIIIDHGRVVADESKEALRARLPPGAKRRYEISGDVTPEVLVELQARGIQSKRIDDASLEQVFLHMTGRELRDAV
ncbi:MAG TPA: ABC transporter ATP-binding protein [Steroidobacteraceae bacterium]|jgi:ABC-2 type transport system ATP-binding protein|nr:ABC transporter ATP-binding protein [Steroidobacteraceae bacterium]